MTADDVITLALIAFFSGVWIGSWLECCLHRRFCDCGGCTRWRSKHSKLAAKQTEQRGQRSEMIRQTHTYAILHVSPGAYAEIRAKFKAAQYDQAFGENEGREVIVMQGIALCAATVDTAPFIQLTPRERQIAALLSSDLSAKDIAAGLGITIHTLKGQLTSIYSKLGVTTRYEAVRVLCSPRSDPGDAA